MTTHTHPQTGTVGTDASGITIRPVHADELDSFFDLILMTAGHHAIG